MSRTQLSFRGHGAKSPPVIPGNFPELRQYFRGSERQRFSHALATAAIDTELAMNTNYRDALVAVALLGIVQPASADVEFNSFARITHEARQPFLSAGCSRVLYGTVRLSSD
jgi:hypothetical protein